MSNSSDIVHHSSDSDYVPDLGIIVFFFLHHVEIIPRPKARGRAKAKAKRNPRAVVRVDRDERDLNLLCYDSLCQ